MDAYAGSDYILNIQIVQNGDYAALDSSDTVTYSVYDINGTIVGDLQSVEVPVTESNRTMLKIQIPAEVNTIDEDQTYAVRIVIVNYTLNGMTHSVKRTYRVIPLLPYSCTEGDVRNVLGLPETVLTDDMIDIYKGYLKLTERSKKLAEKLFTPNLDYMKCNRAITLSTALELKTTIPLLVPRLESDSIVSQTRYTFSLEDFMKLFDEIEAELEDLLAEIDEIDSVDEYAPSIFLVGSIDNVFTGSES